MRTIIKHYINDNTWSSIYMLDEMHIEPVGFLSEKILKQLLNTGILKEVDSLEIIEIFYRHMSIISDCRFCKYYEIV